MKKKLKLEEIRLSSFTTTLKKGKSETIDGGVVTLYWGCVLTTFAVEFVVNKLVVYVNERDIAASNLTCPRAGCDTKVEGQCPHLKKTN